MKPERHPGMTFNKYRAMDGLNFSTAKNAWKTPRSFRAAEKIATAKTDAMHEGSLVHTMVLEPDRLHKEYVMGPDCRRGTKEWESFVTTKGRNKEIIKPDEWNDAKWVAAAVRSNPDAEALLNMS